MALSRRAGITAGILEFERRMRDTHFGQIVFHGRLHPALFFGRIYHHMRGQRILSRTQCPYMNVVNVVYGRLRFHDSAAQLLGSNDSGRHPIERKPQAVEQQMRRGNEYDGS